MVSALILVRNTAGRLGSPAGCSACPVCACGCGQKRKLTALGASPEPWFCETTTLSLSLSNATSIKEKKKLMNKSLSYGLYRANYNSDRKRFGSPHHCRRRRRPSGAARSTPRPRPGSSSMSRTGCQLNRAEVHRKVSRSGCR